MKDRWRWVSCSVRRQFFVIHGRGWDRGGGFGVVNGEVRFGQVQFEQVGGAGQVQGAGFGQLALALLQDVGDVFAAVGVVVVGILEGPGDFVRAVDFDQGEDFLDVMAGVEPALLELLVIFGSLRAQTQEAGQQLLFTGLLALGQERPSVIGMFEVTVALVGADMLGHGLVLVIESQPVGIDLGRQSVCPAQCAGTE